MQDRVTIEFSGSEYRALLEMIQVADWVINCHETKASEAQCEFRHIRKKVLKHVEKMGMGHLFEYHAEENEYYETLEYDEQGKHRKFIDDYDERTFWDNLVANLAKRDLFERLGRARYGELEPMARFQLLAPLQEKYEREFDAHGIRNLRIATKLDRPSSNGN